MCVPFHLPSVENKLSNILFDFLWQVKWEIPSLIRIEIRRSANKNTSNWKERKKYSSNQLANILARAKICKTKYFIDFSFQCRPNFIEKTVAFFGVYILITMFYSQSIYYHHRPFSVFIANTQSKIFRVVLLKKIWAFLWAKISKFLCVVRSVCVLSNHPKKSALLSSYSGI